MLKGSFSSGSDMELRVIYSILVNCSMVLTAYFGWTLAEGILPLQIVLALIFGAISRAVGRMFLHAAEYRSEGMMWDARRCLVIGAIFAFANIVTDYGSATAIRDMNITKAKNTNTLAQNLDADIGREEEAIAKITSDTLWRGEFDAPVAYDHQINALKQKTERGRNIWQRSKQCQNTTVKSSEDLCVAIASLAAEKGNALRRQALVEEKREREATLAKLKLKRFENNFESSPALAQVKSLVAWAHLPFFGAEAASHVDKSDVSIFWGNNSIMLFGSFLVTIGIIYLAGEIGKRGASVPRETPTVSQNPWIPDNRPADARHLHAETVPGSPSYHNSTAYVVPGAVADVDWDTMKSNISESMRMAEMAQAILKRKTPESA